jgi:small nuclear ribonucleoprotein (snRNP)-like protein
MLRKKRGAEKRRRIMRKKAKILSSLGIAIAILFSVVLFTLPKEATAKPKVVAIEGMSYNVNSSLADNLKSLVGKKVSVTIVSGKTLSGFVKEVGIHLIHLEKLEGKDYFDALIRIENISAIEAMFRNYQR